MTPKRVENTSVVIQSAPATEPITTAEAKSHLRVEHTSDDTYIATLIEAARNWVEAYTHRALITQTWDMEMPYFPSQWIEVPHPMLVSVTHVKYIDTGGTLQTWSSSNYDVDTNSTPGRILPAYSISWPSIRDDYNAVQIRFIAGYGAASAVPESIKTGMKQLIGGWYENRESVTNVTNATVPKTVEYLLGPYRVFTEL